MTGQGSHSMEQIKRGNQTLNWINVAKVEKTSGGNRVRGLVVITRTNPKTYQANQFIQGQILLEEIETGRNSWCPAQWNREGKCLSIESRETDVQVSAHSLSCGLYSLMEKKYVTPRLPKLDL